MSTYEERLAREFSHSIEYIQAGHNDVHRLRAAQIHGIAYEDVTPSQRHEAKRWNFHLLYGGYSLGRQSTQDIAVYSEGLQLRLNGSKDTLPLHFIHKIEDQLDILDSEIRARLDIQPTDSTGMVFEENGPDTTSLRYGIELILRKKGFLSNDALVKSLTISIEDYILRLTSNLGVESIMTDVAASIANASLENQHEAE
jgi:hypothetical protein